MAFFRGGREKIRKAVQKICPQDGLSGAQVDMLLMKREISDDFFDNAGFFDEEDFFEGIDSTGILDEDRAADDLETGFSF